MVSMPHITPMVPLITRNEARVIGRARTPQTPMMTIQVLTAAANPIERDRDDGAVIDVTGQASATSSRRLPTP